jgi:hypothetical protein
MYEERMMTTSRTTTTTTTTLTRCLVGTIPLSLMAGSERTLSARKNAKDPYRSAACSVAFENVAQNTPHKVLVCSQRQRLKSPYDKTTVMISHTISNRIAQTNTAASVRLPSDAVDTNIDRVYIGPEDPVSEKEILDEMKKQAYMGTAAVKKAFLRRYRNKYIAFAARMRPFALDI